MGQEQLSLWDLDIKNSNTKVEEPKKDIGEDVKVGDIVQAYYGKEVIQGEIVSEYGTGNQILNIVFDNGKKHTAIGRIAVIRIINKVTREN